MHEKLELLLADGVIDEILDRLKSGKEADIWIVRHGGQVVAAKIYKERQARSFRNNAAYREGRVVGNSRTQRAIDRGTRYGQAAAEEAWKSAEADTLYKLHGHGVRAPEPVMFYEGVLLMQLVLDSTGRPASRLIDAPLTADAARSTYLDLRSQIIRMLDLDVIHGDLSPYNILMGAKGPTLIDFPQSIAAAQNNSSERFFHRDLENVRRHLEGYDKSLRDCIGDAREIWRAYVRRDLTPDFVPTSRALEDGGSRPHPQRDERSRSHAPVRPVASDLPGGGRPGGPGSKGNGRPPPRGVRRTERPGPVVVHVTRPAGMVSAGSARPSTMSGSGGLPRPDVTGSGQRADCDSPAQRHRTGSR